MRFRFVAAEIFNGASLMAAGQKRYAMQMIQFRKSDKSVGLPALL